MKTCPYCREEVRDDARKCRHCHSALEQPAAPMSAADERRTTYVVDTDLVRFGKFAAAVLAVLLVVGSYLFGFKLEASIEKLGALQKQAEVAQTELKKSQDELTQAKDKVRVLKTELETILVQAKDHLSDISRHRDSAADMYVSIRRLNPLQAETLEQVRAGDPDKLRGSKKYWAKGATVRIAFVGGNQQQQKLARSAAEEWGGHVNLKFVFVASGPSEVRIAFDSSQGSWSYLGTDALAVALTEPTMNLGFDERRNALHEFGHVLGLVEEHLNPKARIAWNVPALNAFFQGPPNNWTAEEIRQKVLEKYDERLIGPYRDFDPHSIMTYSFPESVTGGVLIDGGKELSASDKLLAKTLYPP